MDYGQRQRRVTLLVATVDISTKEEQRFVTVGKVGPSYVMQRRDALPAHVRKCLLRIGASE